MEVAMQNVALGGHEGSAGHVSDQQSYNGHLGMSKRPWTLFSLFVFGTWHVLDVATDIYFTYQLLTGTHAQCVSIDSNPANTTGSAALSTKLVDCPKMYVAGSVAALCTVMGAVFTVAIFTEYLSGGIFNLGAILAGVAHEEYDGKIVLWSGKVQTFALEVMLCSSIQDVPITILRYLYVQRLDRLIDMTGYITSLLSVWASIPAMVTIVLYSVFVGCRGKGTFETKVAVPCLMIIPIMAYLSLCYFASSYPGMGRQAEQTLTFKTGLFLIMGPAFMTPWLGGLWRVCGVCDDCSCGCDGGCGCC